MIQAYETYHFKNRRHRSRTRAFRLVRAVLITLIVYLVLSAYVISSFRVSSRSMEPGAIPETRFFVFPSAYRLKVPFTDKAVKGVGTPKRGELAVVISPAYPRLSFFQRIADPVVRFFTLQKVSIVRDVQGRPAARRFLKRIVGLPGDTIELVNFEAFIRPAGSTVFQPEKDLSTVPYDLVTALTADNWTSDLPFSGNEEAITLGEGEYYVLGDNRPGSFDSRSWGPVPLESLAGKVLTRYWPLGKKRRP